MQSLHDSESFSTPNISVCMRCWVEKVSATLHDVEEATARAFNFMIDEKVSLLCFLRALLECNVLTARA